MQHHPGGLWWRLLAVAIGCTAELSLAQVPAVPAENRELVPAIATEVDGARDEYVFYDAGGEPLPLQSNEEIENFLATAAIESVTRLPVGVSNPKKLLLEAGGLRVKAVFKDIDVKKKKVRETTAGKTRLFFEWRDWFGYDIAAYRVDRLLGLDRFPPTVARNLGSREGSVQIWIEGVITRGDRRESEWKPPDTARWNQQKAILYIFDSLVANRDSNLGNGLIDEDWRLWFTDCSRCFGTTEDLFFVDLITHCERELWDSLRNLDPEAVRKDLAPYLSHGEIEAMLIRRNRLVEHIQGLIDASGEFVVLFEVRPPTVKAPWTGG